MGGIPHKVTDSARDDAVADRRRRTAIVGILGLLVALVVVPTGAVAAQETDSDSEHYTVRPGDTLLSIALRQQVTLRSIVAANGIANPDWVLAGDVLRIPDTVSREGDSLSSGGFHVVQPGETLGSIAARHGLSVSALAAANGIVEPNRVWAGSRLHLSTTAPLLPDVDSVGTAPVRPGDTLWALARRYGTTVQELARANGIDDPDRVAAGRTLTLPGGWQCPVTGPVRFVNDFGLAKGDGRFHEGVDLYAPRETPVVASVSGQVEHRTGEIGGLQVTLHGDDGHVYVGTHLERFGASGRVTVGEVIGYVGDSGNAEGTSPHLHFEIRPNGGAPVNPYPLLARACSR